MDLGVGAHSLPPRPGARLAAAVLAARGAVWLSRHLRGGAGGAIGGWMLLRVAPDAVSELASGRHITLVTGTNGKSTTTAMLTACWRTCTLTDVNADGSNTAPGIATTLAFGSADHVVLETDEGWLPWAIRQTRPHTVVLLNLSRDQLHRNPEVHGVAASWRDALAEVPLVVANVDDPSVTWAAGAARRQVWVAAGQEWTHDSLVCPVCGSMLDRSVAEWRCPACGLSRPEPAWRIEGRRVVHHGAELPVPVTLPGSFNLANAVVALAAACADGVDGAPAARALATVSSVGGRYETFHDGDHDVRLILAKNPAGWQAALRLTDEAPGAVVAAFNSEGVDGRDPSWLYDVDFRSWRGRPVAVCGRRASDMTVRLHIDGVEPMGQFGDVRAAVRSLPAGRVDVVANYTAFQQARAVLAHA
jgi:lipid II isoglutaminyl synthase (glutamine-hydrolysing)